MLSFLFVSFLIISIVLLCVQASDDKQGIDDWTHKDLAAFLKKEGIRTPADFVRVLNEKGISQNAYDGLSLSEETFTGLGIDPKLYPKYKKASDKKIDSVRAYPVDVFEWRHANRRLCDYFIIPAFFSSSAGLILARFQDFSSVIENHDNEIDDASIFVFVLTWFIAPSRPFWRITKKFQSDTYIDDILCWSLFLMTVFQIIKFVCSLFLIIINKFNHAQAIVIQKKTLGHLNFLDFDIAPITFIDYFRLRILTVAVEFVVIFFFYNVAYWLVPLFLSELAFALLIYVFLPLLVIFKMLVLGSFTESLGRTLVHLFEREMQKKSKASTEATFKKEEKNK